MELPDRLSGTLYGLAYGDAVSFPSLFHRFHLLPAKRHDFLWETNKRLDQEHILPLALPFTHRQAESTLEPAPTDDTEYALFTLEALLELAPRPDLDGLLDIWRARLMSRRDDVYTRFSERAALDNLARGLTPPATGNDNPLHYEDAAATRAVAIGLFFAGDPNTAAAFAADEAAISQSEDGIWGAQAVAAATAALLRGDSIDAAIELAQQYFPTGSWIATEWAKARSALKEATSLSELSLLLSQRVINNVYSFGNAAPETVPAAFALLQMSGGATLEAVAGSCLIAKAADSLPAMVGALCGAASGFTNRGRLWEEQLDTCRGVCLPFLRGVRLSHTVERLIEHIP
ncbi:MAG: ADP-ribosylglycohydrolase family protein [Gemmatimonadota bacterium]|nr:MAG: ADP-ribosylglycohydrolase family protein [Gemmatimonadota bacterium]